MSHPNDPSDRSRTGPARLGLGIRLEPDEAEEIQGNTDEYIKRRFKRGDSVLHIADRLEAAGADRALARTVTDQLNAEEGFSEAREIGEGNSSKPRRVALSVVAGIITYVAVVAIFMVANVGGLAIQIPALILAVVLGRVLYSALKGRNVAESSSSAESSPRPKLDRNEKARRLSR